MANRIKSPDDCRDGREFIQYARDHGAETRKVGSYVEIHTEQGRAWVPDSARPMSKPDRSLIATLFKVIIAAGVVVAIIVANGWF